ncbi:transcription elongation factor [Candidatus Terasakiella magnetica]|uniref:Transcription elongation factor GreB n=1 Tax=Candidatus Terasakiella magnetica TaxID=1867952 RepID=A0A1C3REF3_9PROT|nr:transcription elongation factor GreB [Candidatus Terasakiella magnetica]SCA55667.1 transcription elongation factor [Candidatus Terasakiella magnetica]
MERPNYITPEGLEALKDEKYALWSVERPKVVKVVSWAAGNGDRSENADYQYGKKRLREIDRRVRFLTKRIEAAVVVKVEEQTNRDQVFFGASVIYENEREEEVSVRIVGEDEVDSTKGLISWVSPVARALNKARVGNLVTVKTPKGAEELEVIEISYK